MSKQIAFVTGVSTLTKGKKIYHLCHIKYFYGMFQNDINMPNPNDEFKVGDKVTITMTKKGKS